MRVVAWPGKLHRPRVSAVVPPRQLQGIGFGTTCHAYMYFRKLHFASQVGKMSTWISSRCHAIFRVTLKPNCCTECSCPVYYMHTCPTMLLCLSVCLSVCLYAWSQMIMENVVALLNNRGGKLYFGVSRKGKSSHYC